MPVDSKVCPQCGGEFRYRSQDNMFRCIVCKYEEEAAIEDLNQKYTFYGWLKKNRYSNTTIQNYCKIIDDVYEYEKKHCLNILYSNDDIYELKDLFNEYRLSSHYNVSPALNAYLKYYCTIHDCKIEKLPNLTKKENNALKHQKENMKLQEAIHRHYRLFQENVNFGYKFVFKRLFNKKNWNTVKSILKNEGCDMKQIQQFFDLIYENGGFIDDQTNIIYTNDAKYFPQDYFPRKRSI